MYKIRMALMRFMLGRYGPDALGKAIFWLYFALLILNLFVRSTILSIMISLLVFLYFFRALSRNIVKRQSENAKFLSLLRKFNLTKNQFRDRKTHVFRSCPHCKANLRLPKRKGTHTVSCPKCHRDFSVKI